MIEFPINNNNNNNTPIVGKMDLHHLPDWNPTGVDRLPSMMDGTTYHGKQKKKTTTPTPMGAPICRLACIIFQTPRNVHFRWPRTPTHPPVNAPIERAAVAIVTAAAAEVRRGGCVSAGLCSA